MISVPNLTSASDKHCVFRCRDSWYSVPAISVREVSASTPLIRVPQCHPSLIGICHLRSQFIPVLSLHRLLNVTQADRDPDDSSLLVLEGRTTWALQIDEAAAITSLDTIAAPESRGELTGMVPVRGTATFEEKIVHVLEPIGLYNLAQKFVRDFWENEESHMQLSANVIVENRE